LKKTKVVAFYEVTFTKVIMMIVTIVFMAFCGKQFFSNELLPEFESWVKIFLGSWTVYGGKSGYENYQRNRTYNYDSNYGSGLPL